MPAKAQLSPVDDLQLISVPQATRRYGVHRDTILKRIADGTLTGYRVGPKLIRIDPLEADRVLLHRLKPGPKDAATKIEDYVRQVVATAPPLTPAQADRIAALLRPTGDGGHAAR
jgi:excisionase family DNA binding protein